MRIGRTIGALLLAAMLLVIVGCSSTTTTTTSPLPDLAGQTIEVAAVWSGGGTGQFPEGDR